MDRNAKSLEKARHHELEKYVYLYTSDNSYGGTQHGKESYPLIKQVSPASLLDVGCGDNSFCHWARSIGIDAIGVDLAHPKADAHAAAHELPFEDESFDWLTAFDVLEHLLPEEVDEVLSEFDRVAAQGWIFSICYRDSINRVDGETLHPTVRPERWWVAHLGKFIRVHKWNGYLWGRFSDDTL